MRKLALIGNWKMHTIPSSARTLAGKMRERLEGVDAADFGVCPPALCIPAVAEALEGSNIAWGAQNAHWENEGAYTGENSVAAIKELGCTYVIVGHSERRHVFGETDEMVAKRLKKVCEAGLTPILCVGETEEQRKQGQTEDTLASQLDSALELLDVPPGLIAYEPVWAIGTGKRAGREDVESAHLFIRKKIEAGFGGNAAGLRILYGGSLKPENVGELAPSPEFDGGLVGGASLDADTFARLVERALERRSS